MTPKMDANEREALRGIGADDRARLRREASHATWLGDAAIRLLAALEAIEAEHSELAAALREFTRWQNSGPLGCAPYTSSIAGALARLDESFVALCAVEDTNRAERNRLAAEVVLQGDRAEQAEILAQTLRAERDELAAEVARLQGLAASCPCGRLAEERHGKQPCACECAP